MQISILYIFALSWPIIRLIKFRTLHDVLLCIPLYALAYSGTTTAGFNSVSLEILLALFFGELIFILSRNTIFNECQKNLSLAFLPMLFLCFTFGAIKAMGPSYNWWGLQTNSLVENINSKRFFNSGIYKGIKMDDFSFNILNYSQSNLN